MYRAYQTKELLLDRTALLLNVCLVACSVLMDDSVGMPRGKIIGAGSPDYLVSRF